MTRKLKADASVVISASHNTFEFNGIKFFSNKGMKIPDSLEEEIEEIMESGKLEELTAKNEKIGTSEYSFDLINEYIYFFRKHFDENIEKHLIHFSFYHPLHPKSCGFSIFFVRVDNRTFVL